MRRLDNNMTPATPHTALFRKVPPTLMASAHSFHRHDAIPKDPAGQYTRATLAAGAVLWRTGTGKHPEVEVALIHRPRYDDWSLAKGKVDPGESLPTTAHREIAEETGLDVCLGPLLGVVTYPVGNRTKVVYYWSAQVTGGEFVPNDEADQLRWVSPDKARDLLSYDVDRDVLAAADFTTHDTTLVLVRHARAHQRRNWGGDDDRRPLDKKGRRQAELLVPQLLAYGPTALYSARPERCQATAAPLADELANQVVVDPLLGDYGWGTDQKASRKVYERLARSGAHPVVFAQGEVIPGVLAHLGVAPKRIEARKASCWVLGLRAGKLLWANYLASPLPVK